MAIKVTLVFQCGIHIEIAQLDQLLVSCLKHGDKLNSIDGYECDQDQLLINDGKAERLF